MRVGNWEARGRWAAAAWALDLENRERGVGVGVGYAAGYGVGSCRLPKGIKASRHRAVVKRGAHRESVSWKIRFYSLVPLNTDDHVSTTNK